MLEVKNLSYQYQKTPTLKNINFELKKGEILSILGANGSGKTTLLKTLVGLLSYKGSAKILGNEIKKLSAKKKASFIAYVPQDKQIAFEFTVLQIVLMGRFHTNSFGFSYSKKDKELALNSLEKIGIKNLANKTFVQLSGGERQLVLLAQALTQQSEIIILDEPTTGLDLGNQMRFLELLKQLSNQGHTIIQTTHYPNHALHISNRVVWLNKGEIISSGFAKDVITIKRIKEIYGVNSELIKHQNGLNYLLELGFEEE